MKILVVCGSPLAGWEALGPFLAQAGLAESLPDRTHQMSVGTWHEQVCDVYDESLSEGVAGSPIHPGRIWVDLLTDMVLANAGRPLWGWLDPRSTWLLDFWRELDSQTRFLLLYRSPVASLAQRVLRADKTPDLFSALREWEQYNREILRFCAEHPDRALLVNADEALRDPAALINLCRTELGVPMKAPSPGFSTPQEAEAASNTAVLVEFLLENRLSGFPKALDLFRELETRSRLPGGDRAREAAEKVDRAFQGYLELAGSFQALREERRQVETQSEQLGRNLEEERLRNTGLLADRDSLAERLQQTTADLEESKFEAELNLMNLHQVQEEYERHCLVQQEQKKHLDEMLDQARMEFERYRLVHLEDKKQFDRHMETRRIEAEDHVAKIDQYRQELAAVTAELQQTQVEYERLAKQGEQLAQEGKQLVQRLEGKNNELEAIKLRLAEVAKTRDELKNNIKELKSEGARLSLELETVALQGKQLESRNSALESELESLRKERDGMKKVHDCALQEIQTIKAEAEARQVQWNQELRAAREDRNEIAKTLETVRADARTRLEQMDLEMGELREVKLEAELNLLQLQQTQEELEHYFIAYHDREKEVSGLKSLWNLLMSQHHEISVAQEVAIVEHYRSGGYAHVQFDLRDFAQGDRILPQVRCKLVSRSGRPALELRPNPDSDTQIFQPWPLNTVDKFGPFVLVCPDPAEPKRQEHLMTIERLGAADWSRVKGLAQTAAHALRTRSVVLTGELPEFRSAEWVGCAERLVAALSAIPEVVRVDVIQLKENYHIQGYEHLYLDLHELSFGSTNHPQFLAKLFVMKLVDPDDPDKELHDFPGIEFRTLPDDSFPFQAWPPETKDKFGPYLRWLPCKFKGALLEDTLLASLTESDRTFLRALLGKLPDMLGVLAGEEAPVSRSWEEWIGFAGQLLDQTEAFFLPAPVAEAVEEPAPVIKEASPATEIAESNPIEPDAPVEIQAPAIRLLEHLDVPGYEHLTLQLENQRVAEGFYTRLKFKLLATGIDQNAFSSFPGIEFRPQEGGNAPFEAWPPATEDQFGPFLRLFPHKAAGRPLEETGFGPLSERDRLFLREFLAGLPGWLEDLTPVEGEISRPWEDWVELSRALHLRVEALFQPEAPALETPTLEEPAPAQVEEPAAAESTPEQATEESAPEQAMEEPAGIDLIECYHTDGYEHLSLALRRQSIADHTYPGLRFKLLATGIVPEHFADYPGLEFRTQADGKAPFEAWPPASEDQFGPFLRLFPHKAADKPLEETGFGPLTERDRLFLRELLSRLPGWLETLAQAGTEISRPWEDWLVLSRGLSVKVEALFEQPSPVSEIQTMPAEEETSIPVTDEAGEKTTAEASTVEADPAAGESAGVELAECYLTPGYGHLYLVLHNQSVAQRIHPSLRFKLLATGIQPERFRDFPGLEFRAQADGSAPFEAWPPSTEDQFGAYLRLLPHKDAGKPLQESSLGQMTEADRAELSDLLSQLPGWLEQLAGSGIAVRPSWEEWIGLSRELRHMVETLLHPPADATTV